MGNKQGFTILEVTVALGIMAILLATAGFAVYLGRRNSLVLEQAGQDLVSEIRLDQSKVLAVQSLEVTDNKPPKGVIVKLDTANREIADIQYLKTDCSKVSGGSFSFQNRAYIASITPNPSIYLIYISPFGKFYASTADPTYNLQAADNTCIPQSNYLPPGEDIAVTLTNGKDNFIINIDKETGNISVEP